MSAVRLRALRLAQRARVLRRQYSSGHGHHGHDHGPHGHDAHAHEPVADEGFGPGLFLLMAAPPTIALVYKISQTSEDGTEPWFTQKISEWSDNNDKWLERNTGHSIAVEEMARDRLLFFHQPKAYAYHIRDPESLFSGSPRCSPPSTIVNLDKVTEHYRNAYHAGETKKAIALAKAAASKAPE